LGVKRSGGPFYPEPRNEKAMKVRGTFLDSCPEIKKQEKPPVEVFTPSMETGKRGRASGGFQPLTLK